MQVKSIAECSQGGKRGSPVVRHLPLVLEVPGSIPARGEEKFRCTNTLSLVSFAGMTLDKCIVLRIGTLTGCPLGRESHPLCRLKNPTVISIWLLVGFHPAYRSVQSTPADNTRKRVWQYIEKEKERKGAFCNTFDLHLVPISLNDLCVYL